MNTNQKSPAVKALIGVVAVFALGVVLLLVSAYTDIIPRSALKRLVPEGLKPALRAVLPNSIVERFASVREDPTTQAMRAVVNDVILETVREAGDAKTLYLTGFLGSAIEEAAAQSGKQLVCRPVSKEAVEELKAMIETDSEKLAETAVLDGFAMWKKANKPLPEIGGLVARPGGFADAAEKQRGIDAAHAIADRILALTTREGGVGECTNEIVRTAFFDVQFRLARMCQYRAMAMTGEDQEEARKAEFEYMQKLDGANEPLRAMIAMIVQRKNLNVALKRSDYANAKGFAEKILAGDPDNAEANFALGAYYNAEKDYEKAESHYRRALAAQPENPAICNNLAMVLIARKEFDEARRLVEKAIEKEPESAEIRDTLVQLEKAVQEAGK